MFKRSFSSSKDRVGKSSGSRVAKRQVGSSMREKAKLAERMNSEPVQKCVLASVISYATLHKSSRTRQEYPSSD